MLLLGGIEESDGHEEIDWLCKKIVNLRIFDDENGIMNKSILEDGGEILVISQFTLHASTKKGNRPSYIKAAKPDATPQLYHVKFPIPQRERDLLQGQITQNEGYNQ